MMTTVINRHRAMVEKHRGIWSRIPATAFGRRSPSMETLPIRPALLVAQEVQDGEIELPRVLQKGERACDARKKPRW